METGDVLEAIGSLVSALKVYSSKLPAVVHLSVVPGGFKPTPEAVEVYEKAVSRFRDQSGKSVYRRFNEHFLEAGKLLSAIQPLLSVLDHLDAMRRDKEITVSPPDEKRMNEYRIVLNKILPGNTPELEGAGKGM
ncbi:MAG: hypothetical protein C4293_00065 [Nitrospiraceae bacterium]